MGREVQIKLTRQSVCMADDMIKPDHTKTISVILQHNTEEMVMSIAKEYLPRIAGYGHTWTCILNGIKCAKIEGNCANITSIFDVSFFATNEMHFDYHAAAY